MTILVSVLGGGAFAFAPSGSAATQTGPAAVTSGTGGETNIPGKNPDSPLCQKTHRDNLALRKEQSDVQKLKSGNWSAYQRFLLAFDDVLSQTSQAVINRGADVPASVRSAARKEVKNIKVLQKLILKARNTAGLNASMNATGIDLISPSGPVIQYVGAQCGSAQGSPKGVLGTSTEVPVTTSTTH